MLLPTLVWRGTRLCILMIIMNADEDEDDGEDDSSSDQEIATIVGDDEDDSSSSEMSDVPMDNPPASRYGRRRVDYCQDGCISWDNILFS